MKKTLLHRSPIPDGDKAKGMDPTIGPWVRFRLGFAFVCVAGFYGFIGFRLVQLQVLGNATLESLAARQYQKIGSVAPFRLPIYDRNHEELAVSIPASSVFARPKLIRQKRRTAKVLAKVLGGSPAKWLNRLETPKPFVWLHRQLSAETAQQLSGLKLKGIFVEPENKRVYPTGALASQILGFTDIDGKGISGLELSLDGELLEKESRFAVSRDGKGNPSYIDKGYAKQIEERKGMFVTLDRRLQNLVEEELATATETAGAEAIFAVVMDPHTGEIFAMGQRPTFDPNRIRDSSPSTYSNRIISHLFEPGSTMKVLLAAEAIERKLMTRSTLVDCGDGKIVIGKETIHEAEANHRYSLLPLEKVIRFSSNVGAVRIAQTLGASGLRSAMDRFGLLSKTGINLPGEVAAGAKPKDFWIPIHLATAGFGQGISVTPLQMVASYAPFANGGFLVKPRILQGGGDSGKESRRVISPQTAEIMKEILISVTEEKGTGINARIQGIKVAGKTGTAQKYEAGVGYGGHKYFASFIGFLPADKPELLIGVMVDEPKRSYYGAQVAAPLFKRIAERALQILDRLPKREIVKTEIPMIKEEVEDFPLVLTEAGDGKWVMPELKGIAVREALWLLGKKMDRIKVTGNGYLESQSPKAGTIVDAETNISLHFSPAG